MTTVNVTSFRKNIFAMLEQTVKLNEPLNIITKDGNAVVLSEDDYRGMMETIYLSSIPQVKQQILAGMTEPLTDSVPEEELDW